MKYVGDIYSLNSAGCLAGDPLLTELWSMGFGVKLFVSGEDKNAGLESPTARAGCRTWKC